MVQRRIDATGPMPESDKVDPSAHVIGLIEAKRAGIEHASADLQVLVRNFVSGAVPDYQIAAWLATVACMGMNAREIEALTSAYAEGGSVGRIAPEGMIVIDKHSTGGVGDKTTTLVASVIAACGYKVAKMSGRGLGYAGGTVDKLESIPGLRLAIDHAGASRILADAGMVLAGQSDALAPGDEVTYRVRDVTGTVECLPLIAASIMSKKIAFAPDVLVLDIKIGSGALTPHLREARELAAMLLDVAEANGMRAAAVISDMNQPLGRAVGNALELMEVMQILSGEDGDARLVELSLSLACRAMALADPEADPYWLDARAREAIFTGAARQVLLGWVERQGGDGAYLEKLARDGVPGRKTEIRAEGAGWVTEIEPRLIGTAALKLGAGRLRQDDVIDPDAGVMLHKRVGDRVEAGELVAIVQSDHCDHSVAATLTRQAFRIGTEPPADAPVIYDTTYRQQAQGNAPEAGVA